MAEAVKVKFKPMDYHQGQQMLIREKKRFNVACMGRRFGKTTFGLEQIIFEPGGALDGYPVAWFAPNYKYLAEVWKNAKKTLRDITKSANRTEMRIELITGGVIDFWTMVDDSAGRGRKYTRIVIDEAAHARYLKESWEEAISPTLTDYKGEAWFISTPNGLNFFHDLYQRGQSDDYKDWISWQLPTTANPFIDKDEVESKRDELPELVFAQEYLAQFVTFGAGLVKPEYLQNGIAPPNLPITIGVDLAISEKEGADYTAIVALSYDKSTGLVYVREIERFRGAFNDVLNRIKAAAARHNPILIAIEQTQYQAAVVQELARTTTLPVRGIKPDKDKLTRFMSLLTRYEQRLVRHDPANTPAWFTEELLSFPESPHDDAVDALVYAWQAASSNIAPSYTPMRVNF